MDDRKSFSFFISYWEAIEELPEREQLPVLKAIIKYAFFGEEPTHFKGVKRAVFLLVKPTLDKSKQRSASGKQGGSKKKANGKQTVRDKDKEEDKELGDGIGEGEGDNSPPADNDLFLKFWEAYPEHMRMDEAGARAAWDALNPTPERAEKIMEFLEAWKKSQSWSDKGGVFVPYPKNFLTPERSYMRTMPLPAKQEIPKGASGQLGAAELGFIRRALDQDEIDAVKRMMSEPDIQVEEECG